MRATETNEPDSPRTPRKRDWQIAELLADKTRLFLLWQVSQGNCRTKSDYNSRFSGPNFDALSGELFENGFLVAEEDGQLRLTPDGEAVIRRLTKGSNRIAGKSARVRGNKSQAIRDLLKENPGIKPNEAIARLNAKGIKVAAGLFYIVKGQVVGRRRRLKRAVSVSRVGNGTTKSDALSTIVKVKKLASELGGISALKGLVEVLCE